MAKQEKIGRKKSRGRPSGRLYGETIPVRLTREMIATVDKWAENKDMSRSEAIRALIERGLSK
jgi:Ribbon-helix-helix protein, copG family